MDVLRDAAGDTYATVMADHDLVTVAEVTVTIASLPAILRMKRAANREKDRKVLAIIEAALADCRTFFFAVMSARPACNPRAKRP